MKNCLLLLAFSCLLLHETFSQNTLDHAGLTSANPAMVALSLRKLSSYYDGVPVRVRRSADNAEADISFDSDNRISASSTATFIEGVTVGASLGTARSGTISSVVSRTGNLTVRVVKNGTITTSNTSLTVNGNGTNFLTELGVGDRIFHGVNNTFLGVVASISNNTRLTLTNYATADSRNISFRNSIAVVTGSGTNFTTELAIGDRIFSTANIYLGTVESISSATRIGLHSADAVAATNVGYRGSSSTITGTGTDFTSLSPGDLLISNNVTLGIIDVINSPTLITLKTKAGLAVSGALFESSPGTLDFGTFFSGASVYIKILYDQSGNGRHAVQLKPANQPRIVNAGVLHLVNDRPAMQFSNALTAFLQTSTIASYLNNSLYTFNKVTAEATNNPNLQFPISTTGGNGPANTISHYGYRNSSEFTVAQYGNDHDFNATPSTSLELHTSVKSSLSSSEFYKNGISLGSISGFGANLNNAGLLNIGYYTPTNSYYNGSVSELIVFSSALSAASVALLNDNQLAYYDVATTFWTGAVSTAWTNTGNWSTGVVPTLTRPSIVVIPAGKPRYPVISGTSPANSISLEAGTSLTITGKLQLAGTINNLGTCTATSGSVQYLGSATQNIAGNSFSGNTVEEIIIDNTEGVKLATDLTVTNNISFVRGSLSIDASTLTLGGTVTNTIAGGITGSAAGSLVMNGSLNRTLNFDQTTPGLSNLLKNLTINASASVITLANDLALDSTGQLTFTAGKLSIGDNTLTINGAVINTVNEGLRGSNLSRIETHAIADHTLSFDQTTPGSSNLLNSLTVNNQFATTLINRNLRIASGLNINSGVFADGGNALTSTGTINIDSGTFKLGSATVATVWPGFSVNNISPTGTVEYASGVLQTISATPVYENLTISATGGTIAANNIVVNGILNLSAGNPSPTVGSLSTGSYTLLMGPSSTTIGVGDVTGVVKRTTIVPNTKYTMGHEFSSITFPNVGTLPTEMSMRITIGVTPSWNPGAVQRIYDFIQTGGTGTKAVINAHYLDSELNGNVESKLVDFSYRFAGSVLTEHGKSNFNTVENWEALSNVNVAFFSSTFGALELSFDETALTILTWNGSTSTSWITATNWTPNGGPSTNTVLIIPDAATTPNDPYLPATASNGSVTIEAGGIVNADPGSQLNLNNTGLVWSNQGTFNASNSHITFTNPNATINGTTDFYDVTIGAGAALLMTTGTTMRIAGSIVNNGTWNAGLLDNTVEYNGNNQQIISPNGSGSGYQNLIVSGTGVSTLPVTLNILQDLTINGVINSAGSTITMKGDETQYIAGSAPLAFENLTIANTGSTVLLTQDLQVINNLTINTGKLAMNEKTLTISGDLVNNYSQGLVGDVAANILVNSNNNVELSFDQSNPGHSNVLNNLTISSVGHTTSLDTDLQVKGALSFTAGKLVLNDQTLTISGNLINTVPEGLQGSSLSSLVIDGGSFSPSVSFDQSVPGTSNALRNLIINSSGQLLTITNPLDIHGTLGLIEGYVSTSANTLHLSATAGYTGGTELSFVDGPLSRSTEASANFIFPVGKSNAYRPVTVTPRTSAPGTYTAEYFLAAVPTGTASTAVTGFATDEYWNVGRTSGPDATLTFDYLAHNIWSTGSPTSMDNIYDVQLIAGVWEPVHGQMIPGNSTSGTSPISTTVLSSFSSFTFGYSINAILAVDDLKFRANLVNNSVHLTWISSHPNKTSHFEVERSRDGINFSRLAIINAAGADTSGLYRFIDNQPVEGNNFYRIKVVEHDASFDYSAVRKINLKSGNGISSFPNPIRGSSIGLKLNGLTAGRFTFNLYNSLGIKVMNGVGNYSGGNEVKRIDVGNRLSNGTYFLEIVQHSERRAGLKISINR